MLLAWFEEKENAWYLLMSIEAWQSVRRDQNKGSRINTEKNSMPADSPDLMQTIRISNGADVGSPVAYADDKVLASFKHYQLPVHFLRMSARLGPGDIGRYIGCLAAVDDEGFPDVGKIVSQGRTSEEKAMLCSAWYTIDHARKAGYFSRLTTILYPNKLRQFDQDHNTSFADRSFDNKWAVLVSIPGDEAAAVLKKQQPSFFVNWTTDLGFGSQVHILDVKVYTDSYCMLISCIRKPSAENSDSMLEELQQELGLANNEKAWVTAPMQKEDLPWFRAANEVIDRGRLSKPRDEGLLYVGSGPPPRLYSRPGAPSESTSQFGTASLASSSMMPGSDWDSDLGSYSDTASGANSVEDATPEPRQPWTWLIWLRQSNEDGIKARTTIPRQLTTALASSRLWGRRPGDRICIYVEVCSSNKHSWEERKLPRSIPRDRPIILLTVNPDRVTRRPEEVNLIVAMVAEMPGGVW
jgi:hypothetical protein